MIVGYTAGVFDLFHIGHLNIIRRAKEQCDYLIVGVSTDEFVKSYKNKTPVIPYEERAEIVRSLKYVDEVVAQDDMDKSKKWDELHFNAVFHGDDWKNTSVYEEIEKKLEALGVEMVYLPHTDGISTTELLEKIHEKEK